MAIYGNESRDRVREAVDFLELVSARTELRRAGPARYVGLCPFHDERTPSFSVDPVQKLYHCFGCGASGDLFTFVQELEGLDFKGALELLADRCGVELEPEQEDPRAQQRRRARERLLELLDRTASYYERYLWESREAAAARRYLSERGLEEAALRQFRVGYSPSAWDKVLMVSRRGGFSERELHEAGLTQPKARGGQAYDRFRGRIMFPLADWRGRVLGFGARAMRDQQGPKYLNTAENDVYHKGRYLYGASLARAAAAAAGELILCEGYTDVIALHQAGMGNVVGLMGTALTAAQVEELARLAPRVLLALDADRSGQEAMLRAAGLAAGRKLELRVVRLPADGEEAMDPAELVHRDGAEAMRRAISGAVPFLRFRVERALETGQLDTAEGQEAVIDGLRPVFAAMPAGPLRLELGQLVSDRLQLPASLTEQLLAGRPVAGATGPGEPWRSGGAERRTWPSSGRAAPVQRRPGAQGAAATGRRGAAHPGATRASRVLARREQVERTFLAICIAYPSDGARALADIEPAEHFTSEPLRRAVAHLRGGGLAEPLRGIPPEHPELARLMAELAAQAAALDDQQSDEAQGATGRAEAASAQVSVQRLQLELARLERLIQAARARRGSEHGRALDGEAASDGLARPVDTAAPAAPGSAPPPNVAPGEGREPAGEGSGRDEGRSVSELAVRRDQVRRAFDEAQQRALEAVGGH